MPTVAFATLGCKVNQFETETLEGLFVSRGYELVAFQDYADVYVINTCSVTHIGEKKSRQLIRRASKQNPAAAVVVTGCYAQIEPGTIAGIPGVDVVVGTQDRQKIVDIVEEHVKTSLPINAVRSIMEADHFEDIPLHIKQNRTRAFLKIQEGCRNYCTYCIIPYTRGPLRSRSLESILAECRKLVAAGFQEIVLTGIHLGAYGKGLEENVSLTDVVRSILGVEGLARLRLGSLESLEADQPLIDLMLQDERLCRHLHLPLQSGSDEILRRMNRHYTCEQYAQLIRQIQRQVPDIAISTDVIIGFPGETEELFRETLAFITQMPFAKVHIFPYSRRKGTPAANFTGQVSEAEKKCRFLALQEASEQIAIEFRQTFIGQHEKVLWEGCTDGILEGLTGNYIRVYADGHSSMPGRVDKVCLTRTFQDGIWGQL
ncbi:tRNA (N(6)-L-threonylcarbamoyladenosine(37)-C(2))-methylthiotransferase MtaB [Acetonema longum]|uniref:Threonylcarbamoyladenosine tRNA methylthiotransferase MtaB n=1 Tax=Acetonema longum DSM 6540 TaxID=1009370 RepID=F7NKW7_9FIRM|nr:tRNA (N(6)-L-threonylcarbamoyladenosine(37)-C(2))-methylthiotransferase MtaB [Acetonema longum]EGO63310.1 MiaB-like tRNA modifying enzyme [Acetonema longum DSM 6540]